MPFLNKKLIYICLVLVCSFFPAPSNAQACSLDKIEVKWGSGAVQFSIEVADSNAERNRGLMFRESMGRYQGMLFAYDRPQRVSFWMRNTLLPLDMIFIDESGVVQNIHSNAIPLDETSIFGGTSIQYVLEINGGLAQELGIKQGSVLRHPLIAKENAAWSC